MDSQGSASTGGIRFPARRHSESARIEMSTREWVTLFRLGAVTGTQGWSASRFGEASAYGYPDAPLRGGATAGRLVRLALQ
jgi:hypothetical protein